MEKAFVFIEFVWCSLIMTLQAHTWQNFNSDMQLLFTQAGRTTTIWEHQNLLAGYFSELSINYFSFYSNHNLNHCLLNWDRNTQEWECKISILVNWSTIVSIHSLMGKTQAVQLFNLHDTYWLLKGNVVLNVLSAWAKLITLVKIHHTLWLFDSFKLCNRTRRYNTPG